MPVTVKEIDTSYIRIVDIESPYNGFSKTVRMRVTKEDCRNYTDTEIITPLCQKKLTDLVTWSLGAHHQPDASPPAIISPRSPVHSLESSLLALPSWFYSPPAHGGC